MVMDLISTVTAEHVVMDNGEFGCFGNHLRAWRALAQTDAEYAVVLEDDAVPVQCFNDQLQQALSVSPTPVVSLYLGRDRPRDIQPAIRKLISNDVESCWITSDRMLHAVGIAIRTSLVQSMIDHITQAPAVFMPIDQAIGHWAHSSGYTVGYTWPSLVDHADVDTVIDLHDDGQSRARWVEGKHGMPVLQQRIAWNAGIRARWDSSSVGLER